MKAKNEEVKRRIADLEKGQEKTLHSAREAADALEWEKDGD